jgi:hypothetical protein
MAIVMRESIIETALVKRIKSFGGEVRKVNWIARRGAPDRYVMLPGPQKNVWVELKATGVKVEDHQAREHERMRLCGEIVIVIDSLEAIDKWFPLPKLSDYELSVRCSNTLKLRFRDETLGEIARLPTAELQRLGFRIRDIKEIREVAGFTPL